MAKFPVDKGINVTHHPHAIGNIQRRVSPSLQGRLGRRRGRPFFCCFSVIWQQGLSVGKVSLLNVWANHSLRPTVYVEHNLSGLLPAPC